MRLALVACSFDQRGLVEPLRLRQHRRCDLDEIVAGQRANCKRRSGIYRGEANGQQRLRGSLYVQDQALEDIVKQLDLIIRKFHGAVDEKIGHPSQRFDPAGDGSVRQGRL